MNRKAKNGIKVLVSLVIAIAMIGIPANIFTTTTAGKTTTDFNGSLVGKKFTGTYTPATTLTDAHKILPPPLPMIAWNIVLDEEFDDFTWDNDNYIANFSNWYNIDIGWDYDTGYVYHRNWVDPNLVHPGLGGWWNQSSPGSDLPGADDTNCAYHPGLVYTGFAEHTTDFLTSPPFLVVKNLEATFDYWTEVGATVPIEVYVWTDATVDAGYVDNYWDCWLEVNGYGDAPWLEYLNSFGNTGGSWLPADISAALQAYMGQIIRLVFVRVTDDPAAGGAAVDDVSLRFFAEHDIDATALVKPDPEIRHNTAPTEIWAEITNFGNNTEYNITAHLQIYKEIDYQPEIDWYDNMESCCVNWTAYDEDGDGLTWDRTDRRYNSPTHSWRVTGCNRATYAGDSYDRLISKVITIPDWETKVWLNFSLWVQGEIAYTGDGYKYEDYLELGIWVWNGTAWNYNIIDKYVDTDGEWTYPELMQDDTQRLNLWGADYDHWNCSKGSGAPWKWWGGIDLDPYLDNDPAGKQIMIEFRWISDPCNNFEGAYIDDVRLLSLRGPEQPLVEQGYKFIPELGVNESTIISFPLDYTFDDGFWYFIEVYAWCENDTDGPGEEQGYNATIIKPGMEDPVTYWVPYNGFNESIFFGDVHDGAVIDIDAPSEVELEYGQCADNACAEIPITVTVYNNGTLAEDIPVQVYAKEKIKENIFWDDFESGTWDKWQGVYFVGDNAEYFDWWITTYDPHTGSYHAMFGEPAGCGKMLPFALQGIFSVIDPVNEQGFTPTGNELNVMFSYWAQWKMANEGHGNFETGTTIWAADWDSWAPVMEDPVQNAGLGSHPSRDLGYLISGHSNDQYYGPDSPGPYVNPNDPDEYTTSLFEINVLPWMEYYSAIGYNNFRYGWVVHTDESGMFDISYPGDIWAGLKIDDVSVDVEVPGPIVWESEIKTVHLEPGESAEVEFTWEACEYSFYIIEGRTLLEGDCNPDNDAKSTGIYLYHTAYEDDLEDEDQVERYWETEDNTIKTPSPYASICSNDACDWNEDHYWYLGDAESSHYPANADIVLQMLNATDDGTLGGPDDDGAFNLTGYDQVYIQFMWWQQLENNSDWFTFEISNDSGQNWFLYAAFSWLGHPHFVTPAGDFWWVPYDTVFGIGWELFNYTRGKNLTVAKGYDPAVGFFDLTNMTITNEMHFRFHLLADGSLQYKGVYIDDVYLNGTKPDPSPYKDWQHEVLFHDDMEDEAYSETHWITYDGAPIGDKWHLTTTCYNSPDHAWWCGDEDPWSNYNKHLESSVNEEDTAIVYNSDYMKYRLYMEDNLTLTVDLSDKYQAFLYYSENYTFADSGDYGVLYISTDGGNTWREIGGTAALDSNGWVTTKKDLTMFLPAVVKIRWEFNSNGPEIPEGWTVNDWGAGGGDTWVMTGIHPMQNGHTGYGVKVEAASVGQCEQLVTPVISLPSDATNLTFWHRTENIDNDTNYLLISTDTHHWTTIAEFNWTNANMSTTWIQATIDISAYAGMDVQFAWEYNGGSASDEDWFLDDVAIENGTHAILWSEDFEPNDVGWQIDDILIRAKPDCVAPTTTCILNPATPDGNNGWYVSPVEVTLIATDNKEVSAIYYSIDGGVWLEYTAPFTISVDGEHTISYYAVDHVGNAEEPKTCSFKIDTTAPTGSISVPQAGYIYLFGRELMPRIFDKSKALIIGGLTAVATASDATSGVDYVTFSTGAGTGEDAVSPYEWNLPFYFPFGSDTLTVSVTDNAGNTANDGSVAYIKIL